MAEKESPNYRFLRNMWLIGSVTPEILKLMVTKKHITLSEYDRIIAMKQEV
jgi:hypothetical protein